MESLPPDSRATNFIAELLSVTDNGRVAMGVLMMNYRYVDIFFRC